MIISMMSHYHQTEGCLTRKQRSHHQGEENDDNVRSKRVVLFDRRRVIAILCTIRLQPNADIIAITIAATSTGFI